MTRNKRLLQLLCLALALAAVLAAAPPAAACPYDCLYESGVAYHFCQVNPPGCTYQGCWFIVTCGAGTNSASLIYNQFCPF
ncbi:MAG TPA: hypothetical protein VGE98_16780 [Thermoanaerobaculia bacterium]